ncbi:hypothetical protein ACHAXT_012297 [Thalassiosira profunda]
MSDAGMASIPDATSLILSVDAAPLAAVLQTISQTLQTHDALLSALPAVEDAQSDQRKELTRLRLALESVHALCDGCVDSASECDASNCEEKGGEDADDHSCNYGIRRSEMAPIHRKHAEDRSTAKAEAISKGLRDIKSALRRLQQDQALTSASSLELDEGLKTLKGRLFEVQRKLASSASVKQLQALQQLLTDKHSQLESRLQAFKAAFQQVDGKLDQDLAQIHQMFSDLESAIKQRQTKLERRVEVCAKEYDVASLKEGVESELASLARQTAFLDSTAQAQGKTLVRLQQKNAVAMLHRQYTDWKHKTLKTGLSRWKEVVKDQIQYEQGKEGQKRLLRRLLTNIMSRRKRVGFQRWVRHRDWHRKAEWKKLRATTLFTEKLALYLSAPKTMAFNRWRRLTLMDKLKSIREVGVVEGEPTSDSPSSTATPVERQPTALSMSNIVDSFQGDVQGATYALAVEIESIKCQDLASLREDMRTESQSLLTTLNTTVDEATRRAEEATATFQATIHERVESCSNDLPLIESRLKALSDQYTSSQAELNRVESSHKSRIDALVVKEQQLDTRLSAVEVSTATAAEQITTIFDEQTKSNDSVQRLQELIATNEERHEQERSRFQNALNHFADELIKTKCNLGLTQVRCETLEKDLAETKAELGHFQEACQSESEKMEREIHHPGIPKPSLDRIVSVGHAYETLAKEKNYVTGINVAATLRETTSSKMKRSGESMRREEEVDVPSEIVAFAHDFAAWVAYTADHESLLRLIAGTNPEEEVYAEDDMLSRRRDLCRELKSGLGKLLEQASAHDPSSSRGKGLRWEARAIFLARVSDAVEAALSKHDQILLPASTRLGRVRPLSANVQVCLGCDRPLPRKGNRTEPGQKAGGKASGSRTAKGSEEAERPQTAGPSTLNDLLQCDSDNSARLPSPGPGKLIKASHLADGMKENKDRPPSALVGSSL